MLASLWQRKPRQKNHAKVPAGKAAKYAPEVLKSSCPNADVFALDRLVENFVRRKEREQVLVDQRLAASLRKLSKKTNSYYEGRCRWDRTDRITVVGDLIKSRAQVKRATSKRTVKVLVSASLEKAKHDLAEAEQARIETGAHSDTELDVKYAAVASLEQLASRRCDADDEVPQRQQKPTPRAAVSASVTPRCRRATFTLDIAGTMQPATRRNTVVPGSPRRACSFISTEFALPHTGSDLPDDVPATTESFMPLTIRARLVSIVLHARRQLAARRMIAAADRRRVAQALRLWRMSCRGRALRRRHLLRQGLTLLVWHANKSQLSRLEGARLLRRCKDAWLLQHCLAAWCRLSAALLCRRQGQPVPGWLQAEGVVLLTATEEKMLLVVHATWLQLHALRRMRLACIGRLRTGQQEGPLRCCLRERFRLWRQRFRAESGFARARRCRMQSHFGAWRCHAVMVRRAATLRQQQASSQVARIFASWKCRQERRASRSLHRVLLLQEHRFALRVFIYFLQGWKLGVLWWKCWRKLRLSARWARMCREFKKIPAKTLAPHVEAQSSGIDSVVFCDVVRASPFHMYHSVAALRALAIPCVVGPSCVNTLDLRAPLMHRSLLDVAAPHDYAAEVLDCYREKTARVKRYEAYLIGVQIHCCNESFTVPLCDSLPPPRDLSKHIPSKGGKRKRKDKGKKKKKKKEKKLDAAVTADHSPDNDPLSGHSSGRDEIDAFEGPEVPEYKLRDNESPRDVDNAVPSETLRNIAPPVLSEHDMNLTSTEIHGIMEESARVSDANALAASMACRPPLSRRSISVVPIHSDEGEEGDGAEQAPMRRTHNVVAPRTESIFASSRTSRDGRTQGSIAVQPNASTSVHVEQMRDRSLRRSSGQLARTLSVSGSTCNTGSDEERANSSASSNQSCEDSDEVCTLGSQRDDVTTRSLMSGAPDDLTEAPYRSNSFAASSSSLAEAGEDDGDAIEASGRGVSWIPGTEARLRCEGGAGQRHSRILSIADPVQRKSVMREELVKMMFEDPPEDKPCARAPGASATQPQNIGRLSVATRHTRASSLAPRLAKESRAVLTPSTRSSFQYVSVREEESTAVHLTRFFGANSVRRASEATAEAPACPAGRPARRRSFAPFTLAEHRV